MNWNRYTLPVNEDVRTWLPELGVFSVSFQIQLNQVPLGTYDVLLQITDIHPSLANLPAYSIQFANENIWNPTNQKGERWMTYFSFSVVLMRICKVDKTAKKLFRPNMFNYVF